MTEVITHSTEADVRAAILDAASENSTLLVKLASTSSAPSLLSSHTAHVAHLQRELAEHQAVLSTLKQDVETKFKRHKKFRNSHTRRLLYRATNMLAKFDAKAMQEERAYFEILGRQSTAEKRELELQKSYEEANGTKEELEGAAKEHEDTHDRIDELYGRLFAGLTPGFPQEDQREAQFYTARKKNEAVKEAIWSARRTFKAVGQAKTSVKRAQISLRNADQQALDSIFSLEESRYSLDQGRIYIKNAIEATAHIEGELHPPFRDLVAEKMEAERFLQAAKIPIDEYYPRQKIISTAASSLESLEFAMEALETLSNSAKENEQTGLNEIKLTARLLEDTRQGLEQMRKGIFENVAGFGEAAPAYNECCDRADAFCEVPPVQYDASEEIVEEEVEPLSLRHANAIQEEHNHTNLQGQLYASHVAVNANSTASNGWRVQASSDAVNVSGFAPPGYGTTHSFLSPDLASAINEKSG